MVQKVKNLKEKYPDLTDEQVNELEEVFAKLGQHLKRLRP